ncbi:MAG: class I SAM-dependent methyltransferase [Rhodobiaceae bacterium]|nr:class I SAM-dependent methyltransferase [Rhodobiaceae bacterium]
MWLLKQVLGRAIKNGRLIITDWDGQRYSFGSGKDGGEVHLRLTDKKLSTQIALRPDPVVGEAYMDGRLVFENGSTVRDLLQLYTANRREGREPHPLHEVLEQVQRFIRPLHQLNVLKASAKNVQHHYDIGNDFYRLWLDKEMNYSCAYFREPDYTLEEAQKAKLEHIAVKMCIEPGMKVLDIGCGWGAMAIHLAKKHGAIVTGISLSPQQLAIARERAEKEGVADRVTFLEQDYRLVKGQFDRIVSIGMMEHVGVSYFDTYFKSCRRLLTEDGVALIHAIGRMSPPGATGPFTRKYIFPGGYVPSMSEVFASTQRCKLWVDDCEILRLHYAWTLNHWWQRFMANREAVVNMFDERFARMWEFYLLGAESWFLNGPLMVFQIQLSKKRHSAPVTRDYIAEAEGIVTGEPKKMAAPVTEKRVPAKASAKPAAKRPAAKPTRRKVKAD